jgi:hypothetical protein
MYKYIDPLEETYTLIFIQRKCISDEFYKWFNVTFGNRVGAIQPFKWLLHQKIKIERN